MDERRAFSRSPRKALSRDERSKLIADMLGDAPQGPLEAAEERSEPATAAPQAEDTLASSFEALDALDVPNQEPDDPSYEDDTPVEEEAFEALLNGLETDPEEEAPDISSRAAPPARHLVPEPALEPEARALPARDAASQEKLRAAYELAPTPQPYIETSDRWNSLDVMPVDVEHLERNLVITASRNEPAHGAFDVLRTRLVQTLLEHNWKRVAITSPSRNCGKTFTAVNLAISLSRYEASRTILLDFDMRNPSVAGVIGDTQPGKMGDFLRGIIPAEELLVKFDHNTLNIGPSLAIGTNNVVEPYASELAHEPSTAASLERMMQEMSPDIVLFDMPPALAFDDVIAFRQHFDGVLMVVGGGETSPDDVREVMRRMGEETPLLGVVLNQAEGEDGSDYSYGY